MKLGKQLDMEQALESNNLRTLNLNLARAGAGMTFENKLHFDQKHEHKGSRCEHASYCTLCLSFARLGV